jgi:phage N-6-adenine-methyltransferase
VAVAAVHFSSVATDWATPRELFAELHDEFGFTLDVCGSHESACLARYWTERDEALLRSWEDERVFCNPPYGRQIGRWLDKIWTEAAHAALIVALVPSRTDTAWWHDYAMTATEIRFLRGRLRFERPAADPRRGGIAPFPSAVLVWHR